MVAQKENCDFGLGELESLFSYAGQGLRLHLSASRPVLDQDLVGDRPVGLGWKLSDDYVMPEIDVRAEKLSFLAHLKDVYLVGDGSPGSVERTAFDGVLRDEPTFGQLSAAQVALELLYSSARWVLKNDFLGDENIELAVLASNKQSSPGYPLCKDYATNEELFSQFPGGHRGICFLVSKRVNKMISCFLNNGTWDESYRDPIRLFIKREPHSAEKVKKNKLRLIWAVSIVDSVIDSLIFGPGDEAEVANFRTIPSKVGMSNHSGVHSLTEWLTEGGDNHDFVSIDKSGWDWTVRPFQFRSFLESRSRLCLNKTALPAVFSLWRGMAEMRLQMLMKKRIVFSDGSMYDQKFDGIMPSGSKITISMNSYCQVLLKVMFCHSRGGFDELAHRVASMGDDTTEKLGAYEVKDYVDFMRRWHSIKRAGEKGPLFDQEFCSAGFYYSPRHGRYAAYPNRFERAKFMLAYKEPGKLQFAEDYFASACLRHAFHVDYAVFDEAFRLKTKGGPKYRSQEYMQDLHISSEIDYVC